MLLDHVPNKHVKKNTFLCRIPVDAWDMLHKNMLMCYGRVGRMLDTDQFYGQVAFPNCCGNLAMSEVTINV